MAEQPLTQDQIAASLGAKLNAMDLTDEERSLLQATLQAAIGEEVQGFEPSQADKNRKAILELARSQGGTLGSVPLSKAGLFDPLPTPKT